jgi:hypothetical protein
MRKNAFTPPKARFVRVNFMVWVRDPYTALKGEGEGVGEGEGDGYNRL